MGRVVIVLLLLCAGCETTERTRLRLDVPESARGMLRRIEVLLVNDGTDACGRLNRWGTSSCGEACDPTEGLPSDPAQRVEVFPDDAGVFGIPELDIEVDGPLEVFVVGHLENGEPIYGCRGVTRGETIDLPMWWPWCTAKACERVFHPGCGAEVVCEGAETLTDPLAVECLPAVDEVEVWEQAGEPCDAPVNQVRCRPARYECVSGSLDAVEDGVCPANADDEMCVMDSGTFMSNLDLDCDGAHPLCDVGECMDGMRCGVDACVGQVRCGDGLRPVCVFEGEEICNALDDDCDRTFDENVLATDCNARRPAGAPAADACTDTCVCGTGPACSDVGSACCDGGCVALATDPLHCGFCGNACDGDQRCVAGRCNEPDVADGGMGTDASMPECFGVGDCNLSHEGAANACVSGECMCGVGDACAFPQICCGDSARCVDPLTDVDNCGRCGRVCARCDRGRCIDG